MGAERLDLAKEIRSAEHDAMRGASSLGQESEPEGAVASALRLLRAGAPDEERISLWLDALGVRLEWAVAGAAAEAVAEAAGISIPDEPVPEEMEADDLREEAVDAAARTEDDAWRTAARRAYLVLLRSARVPLRASKTGIQLSYRLLPRTLRADDDVPVEVARAAAEAGAADARLFKGSGTMPTVTAMGLLQGEGGVEAGAGAGGALECGGGKEADAEDEDEDEEEEENEGAVLLDDF